MKVLGIADPGARAALFRSFVLQDNGLFEFKTRRSTGNGVLGTEDPRANKNTLACGLGCLFSSGARIRTWELRVMRGNLTTCTLDRRVDHFRLAMRSKVLANPAI